MSSLKIEIEWLEPARWVGRRQMYPARQIYGKIEDGAEVMVTYAKRKWKARIIRSGRMPGSVPRLPREDRSSSEESAEDGTTIADQLRRDRKEVDKVEKRQEELDKSYDPEEDEEEREDRQVEGELDKSMEEQSEEEKDEGETVEKKVKSVGSRWRQKRPNRREEAKRKRQHGEEYVSKRGNVVQKRKLKEFPDGCCKHRNCSSKFSAEDRQLLFDQYWALDSYERKRDFLLRHMMVQKPDRECVRNKEGRKRSREVAVKYTMQKRCEEGGQETENIQVCRFFFIGTLGVTDAVLRVVLSKRSSSGHCEETDKRGHHEPPNKLPENVLEKIREHIDSFPTIESHYCRRDTRRLYFSADLSIQKLYDLYREKQLADQAQIASLSVYKAIFGKEYNIGFYHPRKDQCQTCAHFKLATDEQKVELQAEQDAHLKRKELAQEEKQSAIAKAKEDGDTVVATFDLQSVLQVPSSEVSPFYYKRKLCVYNLTVYECTEPQRGHCFLWSEIDGKRGSNEIGSCLLQFIRGLPPEISKLRLFCDSCGGQNRNQNVAAALLWAAQKSRMNEIVINFLETGHTQMQCDSMHAAIENEKRHKAVYCLNDWVNIMTSARHKNPYQVHRLSYKVEHSFFA